MDQRRDEPPTATGMAERGEEPIDTAMYAGVTTDARPDTLHVGGNGHTEGIPVAEHKPELETPVEPHDQETPEPERPQPETTADWNVELMAVEARKQYQARWGVIQTGFVDDPAQAVREADLLVEAVMQHLATTFAEERGRLEERWSKGDEDTEHLRTALQRYRQFFGLLLME